MTVKRQNFNNQPIRSPCYLLLVLSRLISQWVGPTLYTTLLNGGVGQSRSRVVQRVKAPDMGVPRQTIRDKATLSILSAWREPSEEERSLNNSFKQLSITRGRGRGRGRVDPTNWEINRRRTSNIKYMFTTLVPLLAVEVLSFFGHLWA